MKEKRWYVVKTQESKNVEMMGNDVFEGVFIVHKLADQKHIL